MILNQDCICKTWTGGVIFMEKLIAEVLDGLDADKSGNDNMFDFGAFVISSSIFGLQTDLSQELTGDGWYQKKSSEDDDHT